MVDDRGAVRARAQLPYPVPAGRLAAEHERARGKPVELQGGQVRGRDLQQVDPVAPEVLGDPRGVGRVLPGSQVERAAGEQRTVEDGDAEVEGQRLHHRVAQSRGQAEQPADPGHVGREVPVGDADPLGRPVEPEV
nr:hypothetical protein GCM10020093_102380 [Planobispora longispora]